MREQSSELKSYVSNEICRLAPSSSVSPTTPEEVTLAPRSSAGLYYYSGRFWAVPKCFRFPQKMRVKAAWSAWVKGLPNHRIDGEDGDLLAPIKPLRKMQPASMPKALAIQLMNEIRPVMTLMEKAPGIDLSSKDLFSDSEINRMFGLAIQHIQSNVAYIFQSSKWVSWNVSYFCKKLKYTSIMKDGTPDDKLRASASANHKNRPRAKRVPRRK